MWWRLRFVTPAIQPIPGIKEPAQAGSAMGPATGDRDSPATAGDSSVNNALRSIHDQLVRAVHAPGELIVSGRLSLPIARIFPLAKAAEAHLMNRIGNSESRRLRSYRPLSTARNRRSARHSRGDNRHAATARVPQMNLTLSAQNASLSWETGSRMVKRRVSRYRHPRWSRACAGGAARLAPRAT